MKIDGILGGIRRKGDYGRNHTSIGALKDGLPSYFTCPFWNCLLCSVSYINSPAQAQTAAHPDELQAVYACKTIDRADERLACYDRTVGRFEEAEKTGEIVTVKKSAIEKVEKDAFGFNIPSLPSLGKLFGGRDKAQKTQITKKENESDLTAPAKEAVRSQPITKPAPKPALFPKPQPTKVTKVTLEILKTTEFGHKRLGFL